MLEEREWHKKNLKETVDKIQSAVELHLELANTIGDIPSYIETVSKFKPLAEQVINLASHPDLKINYLQQFLYTLGVILSSLPFAYEQSTWFMQEGDQPNMRSTLLKLEPKLLGLMSELEFDIQFFRKIGFFNDNVVIVGANGSGKTSLCEKLKGHLENNGVVISAQRILLMPDIDTIYNPLQTTADLKQSQIRNKSNKKSNDISHLESEFGIVLKSLFSESIALANQYRITALEASNDSSNIPLPPKSSLDKVLEIWNFFIDHRSLHCRDGMNLTVEYGFGEPYPAVEMSDGEKALLFLIAQVILAPKNGFVITDEPEMYLHKSVLNKLWDYLESERNDCIFIYLTHDLDFAASRITAKKIWIKSYSPSSGWEVEDIPTNSIPESLILELIGSRKNILFCEGTKDKDEVIYNILFPHLTVTPVASCLEVISYTRAFNKISTISTKAIGLIDSDHQPQARLESLVADSIYSLSVAEIENILLDEDFLKNLASKIIVGEGNAVDLIKQDVLKELSTKKEEQAANFVSAKVDYYYKDSNVKKGNNIDVLRNNLAEFNSNININELYAQRIAKIDDVLNEKNYAQAISLFNHKGLQKFVNSRFAINNFPQRAIIFLRQSEDNSYLIKKYFPKELFD